MILELTYNFPCEVFINRHVSALISENFKVKVIARHSDPNLSKSASIQNKKMNAEIIPNFDHLNLLQKITNLRFLFSNQALIKSGMKIRSRVLVSYFSSLKPEMIHFHFASLAITMNWIPRALGVPYTLSIRGSDVQVLPLLTQDYTIKLKDTILNAAGVHSVCESLWQTTCKISHIEPNQVYQKTIYTTVPISKNPTKIIYIQDSARLFHFISIGRFHWRKAFVNLLLAFRFFLDHVCPARLTIIGDGPEKEAILYWIQVLNLEADVDLPGKLPFAAFSKTLKNCDALIQSSIAEGFSNVTAEAMGMGMPVFATDVGGTSEIIIDGENGFLLNPHKPQDWWQKLQLVKNKPLMEKIGHNGWETAKEMFSPEKHANEFIRFYQDVLSGQ